jgi:hypothetical protein
MEAGAGLGRLTTPSGQCFSLALPETIVAKHEAWEGRRVVVRGEVLPILLAFDKEDPDSQILWYTIRGRRVAAGGCGSVIIFVEKIRMGDPEN